MDIDMTQVVTHSDTEGEEEENDKSAPIAHIKVLNQPSLKKKLYPIHKGDNTVGRQDLCQVSIPVRSLSKKHACIEVRGRSHFIYDMGSRNRTRRGTHYLTPEVRYELRNNDMLVFADVSCIYLVEDSARASDSGSETDPMSDSETAVFHTVAVDMYNTGPNANRVVNPELIEATVASDPNSCDSAASSDILMPTQDFAVVRIESPKQTDVVEGIKSPENKKNSKEQEVFTIFVADSSSENEENGDQEDTLRFQNNDKNEDSLDMDLLAAATQVYVPDSADEDDDNQSEILDVIQDYKITGDQSATCVPDSQKDDSPNPLLHVNTKDPADNPIDKNGSSSPSPPLRTLFAINALRTYSKKDGSNKNTPDVSSQSIDLSKDEGEETQDPNLFDLPTLVADEDLLHRRPSSDNDTPLVSPVKNNKSRANSTTDETETLVVANDDKDTIPVGNEITPPPVSNREVSTVPITVDISDSISDTSSVKTIKDDDSTNSVLNAVSANLVPYEEEPATVEVITEQTMPVAVIIDVRDSDMVQVDHLQDDSAKQSQEGNPSMEPTLQVTEELNTIKTSEVSLESCATITPSKKPSSELSDPESMKKHPPENASVNKSNSELQTPIKETKVSSGNTGRKLTVSLEMLDTPVSGRCVVKTTPSSKDKSPKMIEIDDDVLEATQPYTTHRMDSPSTNKDVKSKRSLHSAMNTVDENEEEDTQPYTNDEISDKRKGPGHAHLKRRGDHDVSDEENSVEVCEEDNLVELYQNMETLPLVVEIEDDKNEKMEPTSQNAGSTSERSGNKKAAALKGTTKETSTLSLDAGTSEMEKPSSQNVEEIGRISEEPSILGNDKMAATPNPRERLPSEESCSSLAEVPPETKRSTRRSLKDSQEKNKEIAVRKSSRSSKKKNTEEDGTENVATPAAPSGGSGSNLKRTAKRNVHFVGISQSEDDNSEESTQTRSSSRLKGKEEKEETVGKKKVGRPLRKQSKGRNENISTVDPEESSSKRLRGRKSARNVDEVNDQKDSQTNELEENAAIANKRSNSVLDDSKETSRVDLTEAKRSRGGKLESENDAALRSNKMDVSKELSEELPVLDEKVSKKKEALEIPEKLSDLGTVPAKDEEEEKEAKSGAFKTRNSANKAKNISGKEFPEKTEVEVEEDSPPARTSRTTRARKSKDNDDEKEKPTKKNVAEVESCTRVSRSSKSKAASEDPKKISTIELIPKVKRGKTEKKTNFQKSEIALEEEPSPSNVVSQNTRRASQEGKVSTDTCSTARPSRSAKTKKQKDGDAKDVEEAASKEKSTRRQTRSDSVESDKVPKTKSHENKMSKNSRENTETSLVDDDDDFVASSAVESNLEKQSASQSRRSSSLAVSLEKFGSASSCLSKENESNKSAKAEPKIGRKRNSSSQSNSQNSLSLSTPKRQHLNQSLSSSPGTPSSRSQSAALKPKVMFTGVTDDKLQKIVTDLGGRVVTSFDSCTHLVTDKIRRTVKFLCCLSRGIPIVSPSWLTNCKSAKSFTDHASHIVKDPSTEKQYKFSLKNSLQQAQDEPLLENYKIHVTKSVQPNVDIMKEILSGCKAQYLRKMPNEEAENTVVISCEEDRTLCQPALDAGVPVVNAEFILTGILQYDISVSKYQIFTSSSRSKRKPAETDKGNTAAAKRRRR